MAGTIPLSMTTQFDEHGQLLSGGLLYTIEAGTTATPQNSYQDIDLTVPWPNPIVLNAGGRVPQLFFADGTVKIRLTDKDGVPQLVADSVQVIGPSSGGGGGGGGVDATTVLATGDIKAAYRDGTLAGFVRCNGRTIGSATSGAVERANADTQALFEFLWGADSNLVVSGGRGASANADWVANKTITVPDLRGRVIAGTDAMGGSAAGRLTTASMTTSGLGGSGGMQTVTLTTSEMPSHYHSAGIYDPGHVHGIAGDYSSLINASFRGSFFTGVGGSATQLYYATPALAATLSVTGVRINSSNGLDTTYSVGSGAAHHNTQPTMLMTFYIKL